MIVKYCEEGWEIISHYTHGLLAGKIAQRLSVELRPNFWIDVLTAIIEHDDHLQEFDEQNYLTDNGTPLDYKMSSGTAEDSLKHSKRVASNAEQKSQLVALLVGHHLEYLYKSLAKEFKPMYTFLDFIRNKRKQQRDLYNLSKSETKDIYDLLLFCDRLSLILCQNQIPTGNRQLEINSTINGKTYYIKQMDTGICIEPWCFEESGFKLEFEYRLVNQPTFENNKELKGSLEKAAIELRQLKFLK